MKRKLTFLTVLAVLAVSMTATAQTGLYIEMDMGMGASPPLTVHGSDDDWGTKCDLIINPLGVETTSECDQAPPRTSWQNEFSGGTGIRSGVALGYDFGRLRLEAEYSHRVTRYADRSDIEIFDDVTIDKQEQEIELAVGSVDDWRSQSIFTNMYYEFGSASATWTPYIGAGFGVGRAALDYTSVWKRNDDPERIATFVDPTLRGKLAGTTTIGDARLADVVLGYQLLGGLDYRLRDPVTLGIKVRWVRLGEFISDPVAWAQLRSHESSVGRGGVVRYQVTTKDTGCWNLSVNLKYRF